MSKWRHGFIWVTAAMWLLSLSGHWILGWYAYANEQEHLGQPRVVSDYVVEIGRDTLENWQSEFLQLIWQVAGLALLLCVGSPQSKEGMERVEAKLDYLMNQSEEGQSERRQIDMRLGRV